MRAVRSSTFANLDRVIVLDVETTGLSPKTHRVVSIAALKIDLYSLVLNGNSNALTFQALLNPGRKIPAAASAIHGIWDHDVEDQEAFSDTADMLADFIEGLPVIAHNCEFDAAFLEMEFSRCGLRNVMSRPLYCTMARACFHLSKSGRYRQRISLSDACSEFGVFHFQAHDAFEDAKAALQLAGALAALDRGLQVRRY